MATTNRVHTKPQRSRNSFLRAERKLKREQAEARQAAYDALTPEQKLAKLDAGGFIASKQRARILNGAAPRRTSVITVTADAPAVIEEKPKFKKGSKAERQRRNDKKATKNA